LGSRLFPKLTAAVVIILSKASHNGFQERFFSIGTFLDTKQQKKRDKMNYEMDLVQRVNAELMQESDYYSSCAIADEHCSNDKAKVEEFFEWTKAFENETPSSFIDNELEVDVSGEVIDVDLTTMEAKKLTMIDCLQNRHYGQILLSLDLVILTQVPDR